MNIKRELKEAVQLRNEAFVKYNQCEPEWEAVCYHAWREADERVAAIIRQEKVDRGFTTHMGVVW